MKPIARWMLRLAVTTLLLATVASGWADDAERQRVTQEGRVLANGDIELVHSVRLPLRSYNSLKRQVKNTEMLLRRLGVHGQSVVYRDPRAEFDDKARSVRVHATMVGGMKNAGRLWWTPVTNAESQEVIDLDNKQVTLLSVIREEGGAEQFVTTRLRFPEGTKRVRWDAERGRIECELPAIPVQAKGTVDLEVDFDVRPEIMSCLYKLYGRPQFGQLWVARAMFRNQGTVLAADFQVRYRIVGYADWGPWQKSPRLYPTQTAVEAYYPIFGPAVRTLTAETPSVLEMEWAYTEPDGTRVERSDTQRLTLLGMNQVIYSSMPVTEIVTWDELFDNVPLIAATFVSHTDPIVQRFAGMAARVSRGAAASVDDESAVRFMRAVYSLMVHNKIAYQSPPGLFKKNTRQHVKYGRDVLRNRAGTCIDLAVLFASTCEAGGLASFLVVVPGHAFPAVRLPSGKLLPLESTAISISKSGEAQTFEQALQLGEAVFRKYTRVGAYQLCDIQALRRSGIQAPELVSLPASALDDWGITFPGQRPTPPAESGEKTVVSADGVASIRVPSAWVAGSAPGALEASDPESGSMLMVRWGPRTARTLDRVAQDVREEFRDNKSAGWVLAKEQKDTFGGLPCWVFGAKRSLGGTPQRAILLLTQTRHADVVLLLGSTGEAFKARSAVFSKIVESLTLDPSAQPADGLSPLDGFGFQERKPKPKPKPKQEPRSGRVRKPPTLPLMRYRDPAGLYELQVPRGWRITPKPGQLQVEAPDGHTLVTLTWMRREGSDHATFLKRAQAFLLGMFTEWEELSRVKGTLRGFPAVRLTAHAEDDGTKAFVDVHLVSSPAQHWIMINACSPERRAVLQPTFGKIARSWIMRDPDALPVLSLRSVARAKQPYALEVPSDWRVQFEGEGLVARAPQADALVVVRADVRRHDSIDAYAQGVLAGMKARSQQFKVLQQQVREVDGRPVLEARIEATVGGVAWLRDLTATLTETHELVMVRSALAAAAPKWAGHLARIGATWKPGARK